MNQNTTSSCDCDTCDTIPVVVTPQLGRCPRSGSQGKRVEGTTVKAMLSVSLMELQEVPYYFCRDTDCPVVYFSADGTQTFTIFTLRERVYQKEPHSDDVWVCYCFRYTPASIRAELIATNASTAIHTIETGIAAGHCACDLRNPQGSCCLGNVRSLVQALKKSHNPEAETTLAP
jgi:hypothetical protein